MFTGEDYNRAFDDACEAMARERDPEGIRAQLEMIEWIFWEALRGVFLNVALMVSAFVVFGTAYVISVGHSITTGVIQMVAIVVLTAALYWIFRLVFHVQIAAKVRGRRFGYGGVDRTRPRTPSS
jgi:hypothetical protein